MIKQDVGFILPVLENNPVIIEICRTILSLIDTNKRTEFCIFNNYSELAGLNGVPILPISHAKYFKGDLFVFDISSLLIVQNFPSVNNIYYYANNIAWTASYNNYSAWEKIFSKNNIKVIANNKYIYDIYNIAWNNSIGISERFEYEEIKQFLQKSN
jgi:hypothetical protein